MISETLKTFKERLSNQSSQDTILAGHKIGKELVKLGYTRVGVSQYYTK